MCQRRDCESRGQAEVIYIGGRLSKPITVSTALANSNNNPSWNGGPDNWTPTGNPFAPSACGKVIVGKSARVHGPFITGSPVVDVSGAVPGAAGVIRASNLSNNFAISL